MSEYQSGGGGDKSNELKIFPLRNEDLVFSKNRDGILSCGYKVSNALLNATIGMPMSGGGGGGGGGGGKNKGKTNDNNELKSAKIMEDLVIPSSLYCSRHMANDKVFNYKKGKKEKCKKNGNSSSDNESDDNVIEESLYDKLLSLVTPDNKIKYDKKTRKNVERTTTNIKAKKDVKDTTDRPNTPKKEDTENKKNKNKKTKKVRFNL
jgi:hypothetical protein